MHPIHERWKQYPVYKGNDLGVHYTGNKTFVKIWSPSASKVLFILYEHGHNGAPLERIPMNKDADGCWSLTLEGDKKNLFYTLQARIDEKWSGEVPDPQARAVGVNGNRGMIIDLAETEPEGWDHDRPVQLDDHTDAIIWEIHLRDFSVHPSSGIKNKGKYLAFTETGTRSPEGLPTGIDHLKELGVTHVHLLPVFDFQTIDEAQSNDDQYNWGYDPKNYNVPEGSYATDPYDGRVRITEFKQMVQCLHQNGIGVIMDVVYNHMYDAPGSPFEQLSPGYFFRLYPDGSYANGSGCGNETASERPMMRQFMIESLKYWHSEYHIDGFRFDLMGLHDIETMNEIRKVLPGHVLLYGEGWTGGDTPLPLENRALKDHARHLDGIAVFSDDIRDAIRGAWTNNEIPGFMAGAHGMRESIRYGIVASTDHPQVNYEKVMYSKKPCADKPQKTITYVTCHDNPCLWDKTVYTCAGCSTEDKLAIQKFANAIVLTSQGIPFLHAGEEIVRTKSGEHNTYNLPDHINQLVWHNKAEYYNVFAFYRDLIALRKNHPAFRMTRTSMIQEHLHFLPCDDPLIVGFQIKNNANGDKWKHIVVFFNANPHKVTVSLPAGKYRIVATKYGINEKGVDTQGFDHECEQSATVPARSILMLADTASI